MNWEAVKEDLYYQGRRLEMDARRGSDPNLWVKYAELKTLKGSYALGIHGYMNAARLFEPVSNIDSSVSAYEHALSTAMKAGYKELSVILAYRLAEFHEKKKDWGACVAVYERLGTFCEINNAYFLAADAYEHAAEIMAQTGKDVKNYNKPVELWEKNAKYWKATGHEDDAEWSRRHIELYKKMVGMIP